MNPALVEKIERVQSKLPAVSTTITSLRTKVLWYRVAITCEPLSPRFRPSNLLCTTMAGPTILEKPSKTRTMRRFTRQRIEALVYVDLGSENGGFTININEDGMAFHGIRPLEKDQDICITFKLPGIDESLTATAKIVWLADSRKGGALQFVDLPDASRGQIGKWLALQRQIDSIKENAPPIIAQVELKGLPSASVLPPVANLSDSSAKTTSGVAAPQPSSSQPTPMADQAITSNVASKPNSDVKKSLPLQHSQAATNLSDSSAKNTTVVAAQPSSSQPSPGADQAITSNVAKPKLDVKKSLLLQHSQAAINHSDSSAKNTTVVAAPQPSSSQPTSGADQAITSNVASKTNPDVKKSLPLQHSQVSADLQQSSRIPTLFAPDEKKHGWISSYGFGLAASLAIVTVCGVMLWPLRGNLFYRLENENPVHAEIDTASAPTAALPTEQTPVVEPSGDLPVDEPLQLAPVANVQENLTILSPPSVPVSAPRNAAKNPTPAAPQINPRTISKVPAFSEGEMRPRNPVIVTAQSQQPVTVPTSSIKEATNELPVMGTAGGKIVSLEAKPPANPGSATGTIEIISDPYPSIRVPAVSQGRASRPGSLQIGRLVSKIEPLYPPEALRQRISGTVKVHVVIGQSGTVEKADVVDGPALPAEAALRAVQQWHYEPTILGGTAIEVEEDITVVFRIVSPPTPAN